MDWKCVVCGTVDLVVKGSKCAAMVDTGAEKNIIREADAIKFGLDIDRSDCGILHGASCKAVFCGTVSNVLIEVEKERTLMVELMKRRHRAYAFSDEERGRLDVDKIPMIRIHTVPHEPWNMRGVRYPNPNEEKKVVDYLDGKIRTHVADYSSGPYASPWFCFIKPNGTLRWVQDLQRLNAVTVRDAGGLPNADALSESCAGRPIISLIDLYSGYDQFSVYPPDKPVTAMHTPRGLIHMNVAPQGWTNAVAMVQRAMIRVMQSVSPHITQPYIDDLTVKGPTVKENDEISPGIRRFVWKHIQDLEKVLSLLEEHNLTASGAKSRHCMREATILGFVCSEKGRRPDVKKTDKITEWPVPFYSIIDVRSFLGGHRGVQATYAKISGLYYWDGMMEMVGKFCRSCVPCQKRSRLRQGEPLHPRLEREVGAVVHLDLLFIPLGDQGYNYIFDARDNLSGFVDGRAIRTKTVLVSYIEEYYLRYPFVREFVMDRGSEFTCQEVQELLSRAHLREAFRRPEPPQPRVERRQRSQRQRDPEPREARPSRGGRNALARREPEPEPEVEERGAYPECGLGPVEFHRFTAGGLRRRSPTCAQEEPSTSEGPLRELETHLDIFQWRASPRGEESGEQAEEAPQEEVPREEVPREEVPREEVPREEVPREEVPREEVQDTQQERGPGDEGRRAGKEVIEVEEDTPPQSPAVGLRLGDAPGGTRQTGEELQREEAPLPSSRKASSPESRAERRRERAAVRREALTLIDRHLAAHALEHPDLEEPAPAEPRQESCQPKKEMEAEIPKRVDLHTRERAPTGETAEEKGARRTRRIDEIWQERQRLEAAVELPEQQQERQRSEAAGALPAIIESLRQQSQGEVDKPESSQQGEQRQAGHESAEQPRQRSPMGRVIMEPEEAKAKREAERRTFEFRTPTELSTLPIMPTEPVLLIPVEEGLPAISSGPAQGSAGESMDVLLEAIDTMQEEASLFSPEQRLDEPLESALRVETRDVAEGRPQRLDPPEYRPEGVGIRSQSST
ncbi:hypothetical protein CBR_g34701 [Chara braunii]|uniref:Integrase catalytic domain-containing protein n=1 Tax=Chara braunii TaxID=69332 RepID=A0A388JYZ9_CHABU|nr:hypothetical protein CBR_g34701 [Chara braunii]|eukprot:GBG63002.1 hypothetical protein CBR_g34701 [Chara braunii]